MFIIRANQKKSDEEKSRYRDYLHRESATVRADRGKM